MKRHSVEFVEVRKSVSEPVTKFGGQPVWISGAQWPLSAKTSNPMRFICQIALNSEIFGSSGPNMAYIFMTDENEYVDGTWEPDGGENAVILQPGNALVPVKALTEGPSLYRMVKKMFKTKLVPESCEFTIKITPSEDPEFVPCGKQADWNEEKTEEYYGALAGNKIGGVPGFMQGDEFPKPGPWKLLLQLDSTQVPFSVNFGDAGIAYAFISEDGTTAKLLWQCA